MSIQRPVVPGNNKKFKKIHAQTTSQQAAQVVKNQGKKFVKSGLTARKVI